MQSYWMQMTDTETVIDFARLKDAKARMQAGGHVGKIVLRMPIAS